jgi:hypothetical protein
MAYLRGQLFAPIAPPSFNPFHKVRHLFHGWDGSTWDVSDGRNGVFLMPESISGLGMPQIENYTFSSPVVHGVEWEGWRATGRDIFWVIGVFEDSSNDWLEMKADFWKIFRPGKTMRWEIILPNNEHYSINVRFKDDNTSNYSRDPVRLGWAIYGITCFVEQPFWEGDPISREWFPGTDNLFYNDTGYGPPFNISSAADIETATISNPGDVETYVRWTLKGPFAEATIGLGDETTVVGATADGEVVVLDTNPTVLTATRDGVDIMPELGDFNYAPIPAGEDILLSLAMSGSGSIQAEFTPLYLRGI